MADVNDFDRLQNRFRQFRLEMDATDVLNHDHAYQANSRILENIVLDNMLEYDSNMISSSDAYDFVYGEVGADPKQIIKDKKFNVHCCCPVLSIQDTARKTKSDLFIMEQFRLGNIDEGIYQDYIKRNNKFICDNKCQDCNVKVMKLKLLHSSYDISKLHLAKTLYSKNVIIAVGSFIFDISILLEDEGYTGCQKTASDNFVGLL